MNTQGVNTTIHRMDSLKNRIKPKPAIDPEGLYRWKELSEFLPISRDFWRKRVNAKKAPQPIKLGIRCTFWRGSDVIDWLQNPDTYKVE